MYIKVKHSLKLKYSFIFCFVLFSGWPFFQLFILKEFNYLTIIVSFIFFACIVFLPFKMIKKISYNQKNSSLIIINILNQKITFHQPITFFMNYNLRINEKKFVCNDIENLNEIIIFFNKLESEGYIKEVENAETLKDSENNEATIAYAISVFSMLFAIILSAALYFLDITIIDDPGDNYFIIIMTTLSVVTAGYYLAKKLKKSSE